ncbi:hypothetical protein FB45DRAFT_1078144 [Roridomyces roridus]|uniref:F-box domain-containing protein n=1 Tax=Roridomyces roridus TaxID=1738132 RepID=A0AAD7FZ11_9AGAR|nr:hypothetical protein FB45DRAFT_1078144 [Roridomyces roridus]
MDRLPNELLEQICVHLTKDDLLRALRLFSRLRQVATPFYLSFYGISHSDVQKGTVTLNVPLWDPFIAILVAAYACPIQKLVSVPKPIPHIIIYNRFDWEFKTAKRETLVADTVARLPQLTTDTLLFMEDRSTRISRPRRKYGGLLGRVWRGAVRQERAIKEGLVFGDWLRIQALPGKYTLVTLVDQSASLVIKPIPELPKDVYSSFISAIDYGPLLFRLSVEEQTRIPHAQFMELLRRHPDLRRLSCKPGSIQRSSFVAGLPYTAESGIRELSAPAAYIPYLLPAAPRVNEIYVPFPQSRTFDTTGYVSALNAIAALPSYNPGIQLVLSFNLEATALPWEVRNSNESSAHAAPEKHLTSVTSLVLSSSGRLRYGQYTLRALPRWITLFPRLHRASFAHNAVDLPETLTKAERRQLIDAVQAACRDG